MWVLKCRCGLILFKSPRPPIRTFFACSKCGKRYKKNGVFKRIKEVPDD